jgi:hypothetical protein
MISDELAEAAARVLAALARVDARLRADALAVAWGVQRERPGVVEAYRVQSERAARGQEVELG